jgi:hypothetical protein
MLDTEGL